MCELLSEAKLYHFFSVNVTSVTDFCKQLGLKQYVAHVLYGQCMSQEVLFSVASKRIVVIRDMMLCSVVDGNRKWRQKVLHSVSTFLHSSFFYPECDSSLKYHYSSVSSYSLKMEVVGSSKMLINVYTHSEEEGSRSLLSNKL